VTEWTLSQVTWQWINGSSTRWPGSGSMDP